MPRQNALGGIRIEEGSNANGRWQRVGSILRCDHTITLSYLAAATVEGTWTFPLAFGAGTIRVFPVLRNAMSGSAPNVQQISSIYNQSAPTTTSAVIRVSRVSGLTGFEVGDTLAVDVMALGPAP